jgi:hypothetical protein
MDKNLFISSGNYPKINDEKELEKVKQTAINAEKYKIKATDEYNRAKESYKNFLHEQLYFINQNKLFISIWKENNNNVKIMEYKNVKGGDEVEVTIQKTSLNSFKRFFEYIFTN